ncbi:MAG: hypothetical protein IJ779_02570 [Ruminococcus sp.]|nr:hypothetical protein [Ruminococcus sp.]
MLFTVITIENENDTTFVTGSTGVGYIKGVWRAEEAPVNGKRYQIELDFPAVDKSAVSVTTADRSARILGDKTCFTGICEEIDEVCYIRFAVDSLEMLDITDIDETIKKGDNLSFALPFEEIGIYPY